MTSWFLSQNVCILSKPRVANLASIIKNFAVFYSIKLLRFKKSEKNKKNIKIQVIFTFLDIIKIIDFQWKNTDVNKTKGLCHVIYIFFRSSLGKL